MTNVARIFAGVILCLVGPVSAQEPLSVIDWLSDSLNTPVGQPSGAPGSDLAISALPQKVTVSDIEDASLEAVGLLPISVTGLPKDLWGSSRAVDLAGRIQVTPVDMLPAMQKLLFTILLAELDPPFDSGSEGRLFLARLDTLLDFGALDQAQSLLDLTGQNQPAIFRRAFDVALLMHTEDSACETLRVTPALSPTFPARIFCLARGGDWDAAALSLETGRALGFLTEYEDGLMARFLDPDLFEGMPLANIPLHPSPLEFRVLEAIGEPMPTSTLPRAFAYADLNSNTGWKSQIEAVERLVRTGALDPNTLLGLYRERRPAASGGVWDRVTAIQKLDAALASSLKAEVAAALPLAWSEMARGELEVAFTALYFQQILDVGLTATDDNLIFQLGLLSKQYEDVAIDFVAQNNDQELLVSIAKGQAGKVFSADPMIAAIQDGFRANNGPVRLQSLTNNNRLGEAILRAIVLFSNGSRGDLDELTDAIALFRSVGLENVARQAALQLLILERRS